MAVLRSYSAAFEQNDLSGAAVARWRFNETAGTTAIDRADDLDGAYQTGAAPGAAGSIGDGAASFDGATGFVLVETLSGTVTVSLLGDSLIDGAEIPNADDRFTPNFDAALDAQGLQATVLDRAEGGQRTGDALTPREDRFFTVEEVLADSPDVVVLELGTNDALNQIDPATVEANLREIIADLQNGGISQILLTGTFGFYPDRTSGSTGYDTDAERSEFESVFATVAGDTEGVTLLDADGSDKFLGGDRNGGDLTNPADDVIVGGVLASGDPDDLNVEGLHPNAAGVDLIVPRMLPQVVALGAAAGAVNEPLLLVNGTFEVWFTADAVTGTRNLFAKNSAGQGTGGQVAMAVDDGQLVAAIGNGSVDFGVSGGTVAAGELTQAVLTFGAAGMQLYVNGELVGSNSHTGGLDAGLGNFEPLVIGAESGFSTPGTVDDVQRFFQGTIDEFAVYDRALTAGEVQQLFDGGQLGSTVIGAAADDRLIGGSDAEELRGAGGNDVIEGNGGDDELRGGGGRDTAQGGLGGDEVYGGRGGDQLRGGAGADLLSGKNGADVLAGGADDDVLEGGDGDDLLSGAAGNDQLFGNRGVDDLNGGDGEDLLNGGNGKDTLTGGADRDTFAIDQIGHGVDKIADFQAGAGGDVLDLSSVLDFSGGANVEGFVRLNEVNNNTKVEVDANGGGDDFTAVFNLIGTTGLDIGNLVDDGNIQATAPSS